MNTINHAGQETGRPKAIFLLGPTAAGKTAISISLAQRWPMEIISVDSALVYRQMDIGTAKPDMAERAGVPHHLIDIRDPADPYSVADFVDDAQTVMADITARGRIPVLAGGTMLYARALLGGLSDLPKADAQIRAKISALADAKGWPAVHQELAKVDVVSAQRLHPNDAQRLQRALEVCWQTGKPFSSLLAQSSNDSAEELVRPGRLSLDDYKKFAYDPLIIGLMPQDRSLLHQKIAVRFKAMLESGFLEEAKRLYDRADLHAGLPAIRCVGYRQAWAHLQGECNYDTFVEKSLAATRQLAKRQITWLRSWPGLTTVASDVTLTNEHVHRLVACFLR